jgi:phage host-nuclease inhibitor protein Gam
MARKQLISDYQDWQEVDNALRRLGEIEIHVTQLEGEMTLKLNEIREDYDTRAEGLKAEYRRIETGIELFTEARKEEFTKVRSRELTFGTIAYRIVHKVTIKSKKATVAALEVLGLGSYLRIVKEPDKEAMKSLDAGTLAKVGASLKTDDQLSIEPNIESLKSKEAA